MKKLVLLGLLLTGCAEAKVLTGDSKYCDVLPMQRGLVAYHSAVARSVITSAAADGRTRSWTESVRQVLTMAQQNPIRKKTDLVYLVSLPIRQVPNPNSTGQLSVENGR